jgi:hypothetical protein
MATKNIYTSILGYDPYERQRQEQKLWSGMYSGAQSPYERMGLALAQIGGTLFGGETAQQKEFGYLNEVIKQVGSQYTPGTAEYYRAVSDALPAEMIESKTRAAQLALEMERKDQEQFRSDVKFLKDNPDQLATEIQGLQTKLENRAIKMGWNPTETAQEVPPEIMAKLAVTPEYKRILQLSTAGQTAIVDRAQKEEKEATDLAVSKLNLSMKDLDIRSKELNIEKLSREISGIKNDVLASREFFRVNNLDYTKPLDAQNIPAKLKYTPGFMSSLISAQKKALEGISTPPASPAAPGAASATPNVQPLTKLEVEARGARFEDGWDYALVDGQLRRQPKKKQ